MVLTPLQIEGLVPEDVLEPEGNEREGKDGDAGQHFPGQLQGFLELLAVHLELLWGWGRSSDPHPYYEVSVAEINR